MEHTLSPIEVAVLRACVCPEGFEGSNQRADLLEGYDYKQVFLASHQLQERGFIIKDTPYFGQPTAKGQEVLDYLAQWEQRIGQAVHVLTPTEFLELVALFEATLRVDGLNGPMPDYLDPATPHPADRYKLPVR